MIETYAHEVKRKRRAARLFWSLVFGFAVLLYYFFQGYYPAIDFSFRSLVSSSGTISTEPKDLIRSFGIINVSVIPSDADILLGSGEYTNDEKRMTSYGSYSLLIAKSGYLPATSTFTIGRETPYYIELMRLVETPSYRRYPLDVGDVFRLDDSRWGGMTGSGLIIFDGEFMASGVIWSGSLRPVGDGYFLSGKTLVRYDADTLIWQTKSWSGTRQIIDECSENMRIYEGHIFCQKKERLLTEGGRIFTGIISIGKGYFRKQDRLIKSDRYREILLSERERSEDIFILFDGTFYARSGSNIVPLSGEKGKRYTIETSLDTISHIEVIDPGILVIGKNSSGSFLGFYDPIRERSEKLIPFPDISLRDIRITKEGGNLSIKTAGAYLLNYHNDPNIHWLIDGEILAYNTGAALYRKDGILWRADWSREDEE